MILAQILVVFCLMICIFSLSMPEPFTRELSYDGSMAPKDLMRGVDVYILQKLLRRSPSTKFYDFYQIGVYDFWTCKDVANYQNYTGLTKGLFGPVTAEKLIESFMFDNYKFSLKQPLPNSFKYLIRIPVHVNRSIETQGTLYDSNFNPLYQFTARAHGDGRNQLSPDGNTPTGLYAIDYQLPEPDPKSFGPYNVHRLVMGLEGNAKMLCNLHQLDYIAKPSLLIHTGEWENWNSSMPMPNSLGCIHVHPDALKKIDGIVESIGVIPRKNFMKYYLPYSFECQGLLSVEQIGE